MTHKGWHVVKPQHNQSIIQFVDTNSHTYWQTVQIQISWLLRSQLIWIYTVCKGRAYPGSAGPRLMSHEDLWLEDNSHGMSGIIFSWTSKIECCLAQLWLLLYGEAIHFQERQPCHSCILLFLKRGLLKKERICSPWEQILCFYYRPLFRRVLCTGKQARNHKGYLPWTKGQEIYQMHPVHLWDYYLTIWM